MTGVDDQVRWPKRWRFASYNTFNLFEERPGRQVARYEQVAEVIAGLSADVVAIQEIRTDDPSHAGELLTELAAAAGMTAEVTPAWYSEDDAQNATLAIALGAHTLHTGLMWRPGAGIEPDPLSLQTWGAGTFFHSLIRLTLNLDGVPIDVASYHAPPYGRAMRADQAEHLLGALTRPAAPLLLAGDMNTVGAARITGPDATSRWYDPDPYQGIEWLGDLVHHCDWTWQPDGTRRWWADRRPADILISGGLHDVAAALAAPWQPTTGHHPDDELGRLGVRRRTDHIHVTADLLPALRGYQVVDTPETRHASDHLPVVVDIEV